MIWRSPDDPDMYEAERAAAHEAKDLDPGYDDDQPSAADIAELEWLAHQDGAP